MRDAVLCGSCMWRKKNQYTSPEGETIHYIGFKLNIFNVERVQDAEENV